MASFGSEWYDYGVNATQTMALVGTWAAVRNKVQNPPVGGAEIAMIKAFLIGQSVSETDACLLSTWVGIGRAEQAPDWQGKPTTKGDTDLVEAVGGTKTAEQACETYGKFYTSRTVWEAWLDLAKGFGPSGAVVAYDIAAWGDGKKGMALASVKAGQVTDAKKIVGDALSIAAKAAAVTGGAIATWELGKIAAMAAAAAITVKLAGLTT